MYANEYTSAAEAQLIAGMQQEVNSPEVQGKSLLHVYVMHFEAFVNLLHRGLILIMQITISPFISPLCKYIHINRIVAGASSAGVFVAFTNAFDAAVENAAAKGDWQADIQTELSNACSALQPSAAPVYGKIDRRGGALLLEFASVEVRTH